MTRVLLVMTIVVCALCVPAATTAQTPQGVIGYMYTTWRSDYSKMEAFAELCRRAEK